MPVEAKPLLRPDVLRSHVAAFDLPPHVAAFQPKLAHWANLLSSGRGDTFKEQELLPDFLTDYFVTLLGYVRPADGGPRYTISREKHVQVDGKFADAVLGDFRHLPSPSGRGDGSYTVAVEGKGPRDPLDRPFAGRRMSAVDQGYRYAINLPCDFVIVTSIRQTRLYHKGSDQHTYESFDTERLADDAAALKRFVFLLGAERIVPPAGRCHLYALLSESEKVGRELTKEFYLRYADMRRDAFEHLSRDNPQVARNEVLSCTQKLLDRVLFSAFCEDRGLLPTNTIGRAYEHRDPYHPRPIWDNFRGLFSAINRGNAALGIHAYNGGLFAEDATLDVLRVSDEVCGYFRDLGNYDYRPAHQAAANEPSAQSPSGLIDVDILGHIFEQSITDLERLRNELESSPPSSPVAPRQESGAAPDAASPERAASKPARRKKEGAFYTPAFITRYIIEQALGGVLKDRFERLRQAHQQSAKGTAAAALADPNVYDLAVLKKPERAALVRFWEAWQDELANIRLLDPACGSGAFLIQAFDQLHATYQASNDRLHELRGHRTLFDLDKRILEHNLYGVDLNEEAIEICRLSLWIKTAERGKQLTSLDRTIRVGNSVVTDPAVHPKAFDWQAAFPEVFQAGGFDAVVGNPPYIRQELLSIYKDHWRDLFSEVFSGTADIYVYFYALGLRLLRPGGRLAFISSSGFARAAFAEGLRRCLVKRSHLEEFIDLGDTQIFADAKDVYPAIVALTKPSTARQEKQLGSILTVRLRRSDEAAQLEQIVEKRAWRISRSSLTSEGWQFDEPAIIDLRAKMRGTGTTLGALLQNKFFRGLITGLNDAFIIDDELRARFIAMEPGSTEFIKPFVGGQNIRRWHREESGNWLILFPNGTTSSLCGSDDEKVAWSWVRENQPAIAEHLTAHELRARKRLDKGHFWWELRPCDYYPAFEGKKILYPDIAKSNRFYLAPAGLYSSNTTYFLPVDDLYLLGVLNSRAIWLSLGGISVPFGERAGEFRYRLFSQYMTQLPIPDAPTAERDAIADLAQRCSALGKERYDLQTKLQRRLIKTFGEDAKGESLGQLNQKAEAWWEQSLNALGAALKTSFRLTGNPFMNPRLADEWEPYLEQNRQQVDRQTRSLADAEAELNDRVYRLFKLTAEEIALLKREVEH